MTSTERVRRYCARQRINRDVEYRLLPVDAITPQQARAAAPMAAQHTYTPACDGFHEPGQCPRTESR